MALRTSARATLSGSKRLLSTFFNKVVDENDGGQPALDERRCFVWRGVGAFGADRPLFAGQNLHELQDDFAVAFLGDPKTPSQVPLAHLAQQLILHYGEALSGIRSKRKALTLLHHSAGGDDFDPGDSKRSKGLLNFPGSKEVILSRNDPTSTTCEIHTDAFNALQAL